MAHPDRSPAFVMRNQDKQTPDVRPTEACFIATRCRRPGNQDASTLLCIALRIPVAG